jgi:5-methylcytosine-specific restriction protein A
VSARKVCAHVGPDGSCVNLQPCPLHERKPWTGSRRRERSTLSGSREQKVNRHVMLRDDGRCHVCGCYGADEVDHVVPLAEGGGDGMDNRAPIHAEPCHREKTQAEAERARRRA